MTDSDELIQRVKNRDHEALAAYIDHSRAQLAGFLRAITGEHLLAIVEVDDLIQEVSTAALTGLDSAPLDQYEPMQWLQQIARRRVVDAHRFHFGAQRRDAGRQQSMHAGGGADSSAMGFEQLLAASMTSPSAAVSRDVRMVRMQAAIQELGDEQQTAVQMRYAQGLPTKQIAEKLGKTDVAVRVLLSRSMRQLEKLLDDVKPTR
jgi:RNA polymerase sigma-70 factor (ECF subfamily)